MYELEASNTSKFVMHDLNFGHDGSLLLARMTLILVMMDLLDKLLYVSVMFMMDLFR